MKVHPSEATALLLHSFFPKFSLLGLKGKEGLFIHIAAAANPYLDVTVRVEAVFLGMDG